MQSKAPLSAVRCNTSTVIINMNRQLSDSESMLHDTWAIAAKTAASVTFVKLAMSAPEMCTRSCTAVPGAGAIAGLATGAAATALPS